MKVASSKSNMRIMQAFVLFLLACGTANAAPGDTSPDGLWTEIDPATLPVPPPYPFNRPDAFRAYELDEPALLALLESAPLEGQVSARLRRKLRPTAGVSRARRRKCRGKRKRCRTVLRVAESPTILTLPIPDGTFGRFRVVESSILSRELAAAHPELKTYIAQGIDEPTATARLDHTPAGFHAMILSVRDAVVVDPYRRGDTRHYLSFFKSNLRRDPADFHCTVVEDVIGPDAVLPVRIGPAVAASGSNLRTYRLAMTATGEYTAFFGGMMQAQAQIVTTINRVTGIYERDVAIRFSLTAFNIYTDAQMDPSPTARAWTTRVGREPGGLGCQRRLGQPTTSAHRDQGGSGGYAPGRTCNAADGLAAASAARSHRRSVRRRLRGARDRCINPGGSHS
jgi:hypothetical protein